MIQFTIIVGVVFLLPADLRDMSGDRDCGLACCFLAFKALDVEVDSYSSFKDEFGDIPAAGVSIGDIRQLCINRGLHAEVVKFSGLQRLLEIEQEHVSIVHHTRRHFVVLGAVEPTAVNYFERNGQYQATRQKFEQDMSGYVLLISKQKIEVRSSRFVSFLVLTLLVGAFLVLIVFKIRSRNP